MGTPSTTHASRRMRVRQALLALSLVAASLAIASGPAEAFCVENKSDTRLIFFGRDKGGKSAGNGFRQWLAPGVKACAKPDSGKAIVEIFVFASDDAVEGCDAEVGASETLTLTDFHEFDNCTWAPLRPAK